MKEGGRMKMLRMSKKSKTILGGVAAALALVLFLVLPYLLPSPGRGAALADAPYSVHVIDVGQGDAMLLLCDAGAVLIDTGTNDSEAALRTYLDSCGVERIAYLIISHPHDDHMGGADMVLREYEVETLVMSDLPPDSDVGASFTQALAGSDASLVVPQVGEVLELGPLRMTVLAPPDGGYPDANDNSLILRCEMGATALLCTGDAGEEVERWLLDRCDPAALDVDLLKAGHHGSKKSLGAALLQVASPAHVAVSCGAQNDYGFPHKALIDRLEAAGVEIHRTDTEGTLTYKSDGKSIWLERG
jgi:competence protein ComEC